jgi:ribonuclease E
MPREMLVNVSESEECRIAVIEDGTLEELYMERSSLARLGGNIYKGKVVNVEPAIQAAFIDFGTGKNGFLHVSDLHPRYFSARKNESSEHIGRRKALRERPPIQDCLKRGQEIVVQVIKEGVRTKGPTLSSYVSLPGKYLVMMPWMSKIGISQKIEDEEVRGQMKQVADQIELPKGFGFIMRTAAQGCSKKVIQDDLNYLVRLWHAIEKRMAKVPAPCELYQESDLVIRTLRDIFSSSITRVVCDSEVICQRVRDFLAIAGKRFGNRVQYYDGKTPIFHNYKIEQEIDKIQSKRVELRSGGFIVIESTEALVAIDVNSGKYREERNAEETAFNINCEAAIEIARQLRLRDLGGLIVCDFIDMRHDKHRREVERVFRNEMKKDRARSKIVKISPFGIIEMTRQRMRPSLQSSTYIECPCCRGAGYVKTQESVALEAIRMLNVAAAHEAVRRIEMIVAPNVETYLQNEKRVAISQIEQKSDKRIVIRAGEVHQGQETSLICYDERGMVVKV